jgi:riboflavin transporter FmnP
MKSSVNKMVKLGVLSALGVVLMLLVRFPIFPAARFLEYDAGDVSALIGTFLYGPGGGLIVTIIVSVIQAMTVSADAGLIGAIMHIAATGIMVVSAGLIYRKFRTFKGSVVALIVGSLSMTGVMVILNLIFTPIFMGVPIEVVKSMLLPIIIPFNLVKSIGNSAITMLVYKSVGRILRAEDNVCAGKAHQEIS